MDEADWLAGVVLVPEDAAVAVAGAGSLRPTQLSHSRRQRAVLNYRLNIPGVRLRSSGRGIGAGFVDLGARP